MTITGVVVKLVFSRKVSLILAKAAQSVQWLLRDTIPSGGRGLSPCCRVDQTVASNHNPTRYIWEVVPPGLKRPEREHDVEHVGIALLY
jgi:hypothetical protein